MNQILMLLFVVPSLSFAGNLADYLDSQEGRAKVDLITRAPETFNKVTLLHLGKNSKPVRMQLVREMKDHMLMSIPYWFGDDEGQDMLRAVREKKAELGDHWDFRIIEDWSSPASTFDPFQTKTTKDLREVTDGKLLLWNKPMWQRRFSPSLLDSRLHDKSLVIDGKKLIMGGLNIGNVYQQGGITREGWHDTDILIEGPAAQMATRNFFKVWHLGQYLKGSQFFPPWSRDEIRTLNQYFFENVTDFTFKTVAANPVPGHFQDIHQVHIPLKDDTENARYFPSFTEEERAEFTASVRYIYDNPLFGRDETTGKYKSKTIALIRHLIEKQAERGNEVIIFDAYPTFTKDFGDFLAKMASKTSITLVVNAIQAHDLGPIPYYGQLFNYKKLIDGGVKIYEWQGHEPLKELERVNACTIPEGHWPGQTLHTKAIAFDDSVTLIGSNNFNVRSEIDNNEVAALVVDQKLTQDLRSVFQYDLDLETPRVIPCGDKMLDRPQRMREITPEVYTELWSKYGKWAKIFGRLQRLM